MVYPGTTAKVRFEEDLDGILCIRATESNNYVLLDAALVHKGAANYSGKPTLKIIFTLCSLETADSVAHQKYRYQDPPEPICQ